MKIALTLGLGAPLRRIASILASFGGFGVACGPSLTRMPMPLESSSFESVTGLPLHPVVVPFAVVLIGLAAFFLVVLVLVPRWAAKYGWLTLVVLGLGTLAAFVAAQSGPAATLEPGLHGVAGRVAPWAAGALLVLALVWLLIQRSSYAKAQARSSAALVAGVLTAIVALVVLAGIGVVGYTGSHLVWGLPAEIPPNAPASPASVSPSVPAGQGSTPPISASPNATSFTMAQVAQHSDAGSCWVASNGQVYDLSGWIAKHPGGAAPILALCGTDGSATFNVQHAGDATPAAELTARRLGPLQ